jgi:putative intracellular protease/amidase
MIKNEILVLLAHQWCDWEASYVIAVVNSFSDYVVKTIAIDDLPKISMGGIRASIDYSLENYHTYEKLAMVILPGGLSWEENDYDEIKGFVKVLKEKNISIAAICGATFFLCKHGFLDCVKHTGDSLDLFKSAKGYKGEDLYVSAQVVVDGGFITANETAAVEFAYEIFKILKVDSDEEMSQWFDNFKNGAIR